MILGFLSAFMIFKGAWLLVESIKYFRGNPHNYLLVFYHDLLTKITNDSLEASSNPDISEQNNPELKPSVLIGRTNPFNWDESAE